MEWTTIRVREDTKQELKEKVNAENMDERVQYLLGNIETYIDQSVREHLQRLQLNNQTGEIELQ